ncbi:MAG TPA: hypothetical protein VGK64_04480 [Bryobacteraceae bacterium]
MMSRLLAFVIMCSGLLLAPALRAQIPEAPFDWGPYQTDGSATVGYRFDDIGGRKEMFKQLFGLDSGLRLFDFNLTGKAKQGTNPFADTYQLTASGLGGDPFPGGQLTVSKSHVYDFRVNYRQSYYYWDQNDNALLPNGLHGLTSNHNWATVRRLGSVNLLVHATNNLRFRFEYNLSAYSGTLFATRTLDYFGAPASWGTFLRDNPYYVTGPTNDASNSTAGGIDYTLKSWTFHYTGGYQSFHQRFNWTNPAVERSINIDSTANVKELLASGNWNEFRRLNAPFSQLFFNGKIIPRLSWRGDFLYFNFSGPSIINASYVGTARANTSGSLVAPHAISLNSNAQLKEPSYVVDQGFTLKLTEWWNFDADYRFNRNTENATANFLGQDTSISTTGTSGTTNQRWRQSSNQLDLRMEFTPFTGLVISPGIRLLKSDTLAISDGQVDQTRTLRTKTAWPIGSLFYQPIKILTIRGDFQSITNNTSYTRITPHTDVGTRWTLRLRLNSKFSIEDNVVVRNRKLLDTDFHNTIRSSAAVISYTPSEHWSAFAGFSYDSFFAMASVTFLRGTPPLSTSWRDQTVDRVWQLGFKAEPMRRLGFDFTGNYVRSTGSGQITGELPRFGPLTFPTATATVRYDVPRLGRFSLDLQRTYYHEEIIRGNDFTANLLTVRWGIPFRGAL